MNFKQPNEFEHTEDKPYISTGMNRNTKVGKEYVGAWADLAEFNDLFLRGKNGLDIDEMIPSSCYIARKNYIDLLDVSTQKVKIVGNTLKSKKMPIYIEKFIDDTVRDLLNDRGYEYLDKYYNKIEEIYNLRIPLKDIATVGKIKIDLDTYKENCKERTKSGTKKSRQAWYELAIKHNLDVHMGDSIYYINTGTKKGQSDIQRVTHFFMYDTNNEKIDMTKEFKKEWNKCKKDAKLGIEEAIQKIKYNKNDKECTYNLEDYIKKYYPNAWDEDEIIFNCVLLPSNIVNSEVDVTCGESGVVYNVEKYISMFNKRIKPQLVCFDKNIRGHIVTKKNGKTEEVSDILITNPIDRKIFTHEQTKLVSGQPFNPGDQDSYEQLMTMEDKEIRFWISVNKEPIYWKECGMDWSVIKEEYLQRMDKLKEDGIKEEYAEFLSYIDSITSSEVEDILSDGSIPERFLKICDMDAKNGSLISKKWNIKLGSIYDIVDHFGDIKFETHDDDEINDKLSVGGIKTVNIDDFLSEDDENETDDDEVEIDDLF